MIVYDETYSYELFEDGYDIYKDGRKIVAQHDPYGKVYDLDGTYEENAILQLKEMTKKPEPTPVGPTDDEVLRADLDYLALMTDVVLSSQEEGGE